MNNDTYDAIVLGGGGAGLMCAAVAGQGGKRVLVIDHADAVGKKTSNDLSPTPLAARWAAIASTSRG